MNPTNEQITALEGLINYLTINKPDGWQAECERISAEIHRLFDITFKGREEER